uniref:Nucleolar pre-ribosomal-associated protein 1 n=1 Tax=Phallusia mammillata TaxID=59560 RepID=A0A6F9DVT6_9ASCI|nr:nucleolar pre-ribosomal-associated protein 1 [Phallusia mammillata]
MGKRKKKSGNEIDSKRQKSGKAANSERPGKEKEIFTSIEFIQLLQDPVLYVKGLQRFCQASRLFRDSIITHDVVKAYISVSPECSEIFKCIEKGKTSSMNVCLVFETFFTILLRTGGNLAETYASVGVSMCRRILQAHLRELYGALSLRNPAKVIVPTLRMLTSMVMQGSECANDVVTSLDLGGKVMTALAKYQPAPKHEKQGASTNVRLCFVRFVLSFFMSDDVETLKQVLEARGFVDAVFRGLPKDPASVIHIFLSGLLDKVIKNLKIPKTNKIKLLAAHDVLLSVAELFSWDGNYDIDLDDEDEEKDQEKSADTCKTAGIEKIHQLAYDFLYHSCCPFKYGINFRDKQYGTSVRSQNHVLLKFLIDLKGASSNKFAHKLVVEILKACPDLLTSYLLTCNLSFDPRPSEK